MCNLVPVKVLGPDGVEVTSWCISLDVRVHSFRGLFLISWQ